ncbi:MAG: hypothetical protein ABWZ86_06760 [Hyphomicrobium sp.]
MLNIADSWAQKLIAASQLREEKYLEIRHLDWAPVVLAYVAVRGLRYGLRIIRSHLHFRSVGQLTI